MVKVVDQRVTLKFNGHPVGQLDPVDETRGFTVIPVAPAPEDRYPPNDDWTEPEFVDWGIWETWLVHATIGLDGTQKVIRDHSIKAKCTDMTYGTAIFTLLDGLEINADIYPRFIFLIALEKTFTGLVAIQLEDSVGNIVYRTETINVLEWSLLTLPVGSVNDAFWTHTNTFFDWTSIKRIIIQCPFPGAAGSGTFWLDGIYFTYKIAGVRALDITVVVKDTDPPIPVVGATVIYGHLVGVDPETGEETYFWMDGEKQITGADGRVVFSELEPDWYGLKVSAEGFKDVLVTDLDLTEVDKMITVELEAVSLWDMLLPALVFGGIIVGTLVVVEKL